MSEGARLPGPPTAAMRSHRSCPARRVSMAPCSSRLSPSGRPLSASRLRPALVSTCWSTYRFRNRSFTITTINEKKHFVKKHPRTVPDDKQPIFMLLED